MCIQSEVGVVKFASHSMSRGTQTSEAMSLHFIMDGYSNGIKCNVSAFYSIGVSVHETRKLYMTCHPAEVEVVSSTEVTTSHSHTFTSHR